MAPTIPLTAATTAALVDRFVHLVPMTGQPRTDSLIILGAGLALLGVGVLGIKDEKLQAVRALVVGIGMGAAVAGGVAAYAAWR